MTLGATLLALAHNAALLLSLAVLFDIVTTRYPMGVAPSRQVFLGAGVGAVGMAIMLAPLQFAPGVVFDSRSVLLAVTGLFLGGIPALIAAVMTAALRLYQGGAAAWTGTAVIAASAGIGIGWRHWRRDRLHSIAWSELYVFGLLVHVVMLALMFTLPFRSAWRVVSAMAVPILLVYPLATALLGGLLAGRLRREQASSALREREEQLRALFETASIGIAQADVITGQWLRVNAKMCEITGYSEEELLALHIPDITHAEDRDRDWELFQRVVRGEAPSYRLEKRYVRKDGSLVWVNVNMTVVRDDGGHPVWTIATIEDISERKRAEEAARTAHERWTRIFSSDAVGVAVGDAQGGLWEVNDFYLHLLGYTRADLEAGLVHWNESTAPEHRAAAARAIEQLRAEGTCAPYEKEYVRKDGSRVWVLVAYTRLPGPEERFLAFVVDVTERKRAEEEARRLLETAQQSRRVLLSVVEDQKRAEEVRYGLERQLAQAQKMESIGRLAGGVAHDFNNALGVILGRAELAAGELAPGHPLREGLATIRDAALRSANLTRQLLAFARQQTIAPKVLDLNDAVSGMLKMLQRLIGEDIQLVWIPGATLWPVKMDPAQVDQILANLLVNARDAIGGVGRVTVETRNTRVDATYRSQAAGPAPGEYVMLSVSDDGCGMAKDVLEHLFEPFFTTKAVGQGTGLGLATVYGIVQQNAGFINVYSEPQQGAVFKIYLPRTTEVATNDEVDRALREPRGQGETVLLVEDDPAMLEVGADTLEGLGYHVLRAAGPNDAVRMAHERDGGIHLLITDVVMPEMNGKDLAERLAESHRALRCLFVSGYTADIIAHRGVLDEGVHFLQKPFSRIDLALKVREALDESAPE